MAANDQEKPAASNFTVKMEEKGSSVTVVNTYNTTKYHNPGDCYLNFYRHKNIKSII